jgi:hypothetical protein
MKRSEVSLPVKILMSCGFKHSVHTVPTFQMNPQGTSEDNGIRFLQNVCNDNYIVTQPRRL